MGLAESRADMTSDNMSAIAFNWGGRTYDSLSISAATMPLDITTTIINFPAENTGQSVISSDADTPLSDEEIESTIAKIQDTIKKNHK